jgi:hypothetical protein
MLTCFRLMTNLEARLEKEDLYSVFRDQEMPLATIIASTHNLARAIPLLAAALTNANACIIAPQSWSCVECVSIRPALRNTSKPSSTDYEASRSTHGGWWATRFASLARRRYE